jgi:hypothetical protein
MVGSQTDTPIPTGFVIEGGQWRTIETTRPFVVLGTAAFGPPRHVGAVVLSDTFPTQWSSVSFDTSARTGGLVPTPLALPVNTGAFDVTSTGLILVGSGFSLLNNRPSATGWGVFNPATGVTHPVPGAIPGGRVWVMGLREFETPTRTTFAVLFGGVSTDADDDCEEATIWDLDPQGRATLRRFASTSDAPVTSALLAGPEWLVESRGTTPPRTFAHSLLAPGMVREVPPPAGSAGVEPLGATDSNFLCGKTTHLLRGAPETFLVDLDNLQTAPIRMAGSAYSGGLPGPWVGRLASGDGPTIAFLNSDANGNTFTTALAPARCPTDLTGDDATTTEDLVVFLGGFGAPSDPWLATDLTGDGQTTTADLVEFLGGFGCQPTP